MKAPFFPNAREPAHRDELTEGMAGVPFLFFWGHSMPDQPPSCIGPPKSSFPSLILKRADARRRRHHRGKVNRTPSKGV